MTNFKEFLINNCACTEALDWLGERNAEQTWVECPRGDWMLWLVDRVVADDDLKKEVVRIALDCAKLSLVATEDPRVSDCCHVVERWLAGESVDLEAAHKEAWSAARAAKRSAAEWTIRSVAWAVLSANSIYGYAVWAAESAWWSAESSARLSVCTARHLECADIVRRHIPWIMVKPFIERKV